MIKPKEDVSGMERYTPPLEGRRGNLRLDFNENAIGCSPKVIEAIRRLNADEIATYPEYDGFLKKLADYLNVDVKEVMPTNGSDEAIKIAFDAFLDKGNEIIIPVPTFDMFRMYAQAAGAKIREVLYNDDLSFPTERLVSAINETTKIIVLVNPNNPTGTTIPKEDIERIIRKARDCMILIDEAYYQFYGKSSKEMITKYDNIILIQTFSKAFGLGGLRLGYMISNDKNIEALRKLASPYSVNVVALAAGEAALDDLQYVQRYVDEVKASRKYLINKMRMLGIKSYPSEANFILADFGNKNRLICQALKKKQILVRDRSSNPLLKGCVRLSIGTREQTKRLFDEIKRIFEIKTILFDMDGVLADVSQSYRIAIQKTAEYFVRAEIIDEEIQNTKQEGGFNNDWNLTYELIRRKGIIAEFSDVKQKFQQYYLGNNLDGLINNEGLMIPREIIEGLSRRYALGIVTGRPRDEAEFFLAKNNISKFFRCVVCMEDVNGKEKPDPYGIQIALKIMGAKGEEGMADAGDAFYIGDSIDDIEAANNAGIISIGFIPPYTDAARLKEAMAQKGAVLFFDDANEMLEVLK